DRDGEEGEAARLEHAPDLAEGDLVVADVLADVRGEDEGVGGVGEREGGQVDAVIDVPPREIGGLVGGDAAAEPLAEARLGGDVQDPHGGEGPAGAELIEDEALEAVTLQSAAVRTPGVEAAAGVGVDGEE